MYEVAGSILQRNLLVLPTSKVYIFYFTRVRFKVEYISVLWNSITYIGANKLERIQQKFAALCFNTFSPVNYSYGCALEHSKWHALRKRK
jgi:hypothetical protein